MADAYILGTGSTPFRKWPDRSFRDLAREAVLSALSDAGIDGAEVAHVQFGNCAMGVWGQANVRGQTVLLPLVAEGVLAPHTPIANVEGGCATGSLALQAAVRDVLSGEAAVSLAIGVEKTFIPDDPAKSFALFAGGADQLHPDEWQGDLRDASAAFELGFEPHPARVVFLDVHALLARRHMQRHGTTVAQIAAGAAKNHNHGALNPKAQYRFETTVDQVLADRPVVAPLTRSMCAPISDGAAAAVVCSEAFLREVPASVRDRAVRVRACVTTGGRRREIDEPTLVAEAAVRAWRRSGLSPADVDVAEVHDATSFCEILHLEALGLCPEGEGGAFVASGATALGGSLPVNLSGGLVSKGHPLGATGLSMIDELVLQLRGEAGDRQAQVRGGPPRVALQQNAGGLVGLDEALCSVCVLEAP